MAVIRALPSGRRPRTSRTSSTGAVSPRSATPLAHAYTGRPSTDTEDDDDDLAPYRRPVARPRAQNGNERWRARQNDEAENLRKAIEESSCDCGKAGRAACDRTGLSRFAERGVFDDTDFVGLTAPLIDLDSDAQTNIQPQLTSVLPQYTAVLPLTSTGIQSYNPIPASPTGGATVGVCTAASSARQRAALARQQMETQPAAAAAQQAQLLLRQQQQQRPLVPQPTAFGSFVASPPAGLWYGDLADSLGRCQVVAPDDVRAGVADVITGAMRAI